MQVEVSVRLVPPFAPEGSALALISGLTDAIAALWPPPVPVDVC